jgi:hypothetical protein
LDGQDLDCRDYHVTQCDTSYKSTFDTTEDTDFDTFEYVTEYGSWKYAPGALLLSLLSTRNASNEGVVVVA